MMKGDLGVEKEREHHLKKRYLTRLQATYLRLPSVSLCPPSFPLPLWSLFGLSIAISLKNEASYIISFSFCPNPLEPLLQMVLRLGK